METKPRPEVAATETLSHEEVAGGFFTESVTASAPPTTPTKGDQPAAPFPAPAPPATPPPAEPDPLANLLTRRNLGLGALGLGIIFALAHVWLLALLGIVAGALLLLPGVSMRLLRRQRIIERWDTLVDGARGQAEQVVGTTVRELTAMQLPSVQWTERSITPGILRGLAGDTRPFLVVNHSRNQRLKSYRLYVSVRDYGTSLQTSWFLAFHPPFWKWMRNTYTPSLNLGLDLFDEQDLRAYVTAVHHAFLTGVVELLASQGKDASQLNRNSRGFLGIS